MNNKRRIIIVLLSIFIVLFAYCFFYGLNKHNKQALENFKIIEVLPKNGFVYYSFEENYYADHYEIIINQNGNDIIEEVYSHYGYLNTKINYQDNLNIKVIAYNRLNEQKVSSNNIKLTWEYPTFSSDNSIYITSDKVVMIDGNLNNNYSLVLESNDKEIYNKKISVRNNIIDYNSIKNNTGRIIAYIKDDNDYVSRMNFYINTPVVESVNIISPDSERIEYEDFVFEFTGGDNATNYYLEIYEDNKLIDKKEIKEKLIKMNINNYKEEMIYKLKVIAKLNNYDELSRSDEISFKVKQKDVVNEVYTNTDFKTLKSGKKLELLTHTKKATIYYSLDGSDPKTKYIYTGPITIKNDCILKAVAIKNNITSQITTFDISVKEKIPVVYISPSNQHSNYGVSSVGYTNERAMMQNLGTVVVNRLKEAGIIVYRNNPDQNMTYWMDESNYIKADLHLAIHSNGSTKHDKAGVEVYVEDEVSKSYSIAQMLYDNIYELYPYKSPDHGRGVMFAKGMMGEVHPSNVMMGTLIEVAYHDDYKDAKWIVDNMDDIGNAIANAVIKYFDIN